MKEKIFIVITLFFCSQLIISCCRNPREFFDFSKVRLEVDLEQQEIITNDSLIILINATDYGLVAGLFNEFGFKKTMALSCEEGFNGLKFPIESIEIISNQDFDTQHPAGTPLNDLFKQLVFDDLQQAYTTPKLIEIEEFMDAGTEEIALFTAPTLSKRHQFTLILTKSDGTTITANTDTIRW